MENKCKYHYVYLTFDTKNGMFYCGKRSTNTPILKDKYYGSGNIIRNILKSKSNIEERLVKIILQVNEDYQSNIISEKYWVNEVFDAPNNLLFYNISTGGYGGSLITGFTDEQKKEVYSKIGIGNKGKILTDEQKQKISGSNKGLKRSLESKKNYSSSKIGIKNPFYGKKHTTESLEKISNSSNGENNSRAVFIQIISKDDNIIFEGIRKDIAKWCIDNGICSESNMKNHLYNGSVFNPNYSLKKFPNSKNYIGVRFKYKN